MITEQLQVSAEGITVESDTWKPTRKQIAFAAIPDNVLEGFYAGAVHAGKSDILLLIPILKRWHELEGFKGLFLRRTFPELKNEIIPRSYKYYRHLGAKYNQQDKVWKFPSGALIFFGHCEDENDVHNYDSMEINYAAFDELTSFTEWQYRYITNQRVRAKLGSNLPAIVRSASNPGNTGHNWVRKRFIDPYPEGGRIIKNKAGTLRMYVPATAYDNPYTSPEYLKSLESLPEAEKQAKLYGRWDAYEGSVFDEFRDKPYEDEPPNALHVIEPFEIPAYWPRIYSIDWGYAPPAMTYAVCAAITPNERMIIYREEAWQKTRISEWTPYIKEWIAKDNPRVIKLCKSAGQEHGQEHTIQGEIDEGLGISTELTNNAPGTRVAGKMLFHEYLRWKQKYIPTRELVPYDQKKADWLLRNRGITEYKSYQESYNPPVIEENIPKLQIFNTCPLLINAIKSCTYSETHTQDVRGFDGDDPYDATRYLIDAADKFFSESIRSSEDFKLRAELENHLAETKDMTSFYRRAMQLERNERKQFGVRRIHSHAR